ncbi:hypothetical protein RFI_22420 [Reticulomyxa filosa]|uniref:Uncharacterized protein n=1 Tax=Reticulomyxa filosa TaxID=46433 RepID=X6MM91_RETFI|nr:hypothetical protein RFI_22420 [Reticulomyxa filosa]|eukprot:ETO14949.1 hypothetical protein RFI_22420 [Reticulomyxa filosa]
MLAMILLTITEWVFWSNHTALRSSMFSQIKCELENHYYTQAYAALHLVYPAQPCARTHTISPFWFISWVISCASAVSAQLILSCHAKTRSRLQRVTTKIFDEINLSKKKSTVDFDDDNIKSGSDRDNHGRKITEFEPEIQMNAVKTSTQDNINTANTNVDNTTTNPPHSNIASAGQGSDRTQETDPTSTQPTSLEVNPSGGQESLSPKEEEPQRLDENANEYSGTD